MPTLAATYDELANFSRQRKKMIQLNEHEFTNWKDYFKTTFEETKKYDRIEEWLNGQTIIEKYVPLDKSISFNQMDYGDYADNYFELADQFEILFKRPVDLITEKSLKNPYFIHSVNQTKTLIYGQ